MTTIHFVDTTFRDGQQSLWAINMPTAMMLPAAPALEHAGFDAIEVMGNAFFKKCVRDLREDPWERLRLLRERMPHTPLRTLRGRYNSAFQRTPQVSDELWMRRMVAYGVEEARILDPSNTVANWEERVQWTRNAGMKPIVDLIFSYSPKHTDAYYLERTRKIADMHPYRMVLKDPGGLLTPERVRTLVPLVLENAGEVPVELHTHCTTGLGPLTALEAVQLGIRVVHTALSPLANGSSMPSFFPMVRNLQALGYDVSVDGTELASASEAMTRDAKRLGFPVGIPAEYDVAYYRHQIPGGMISNLRSQLTRLGVVDRLPQVLEECARVREELGYPIMVTPYSQFVGTQAVFNVLSGGRYREASDEMIQYALGMWGEEERDGIDPEVRDKIVDRARARELASHPFEEPSLEEFRARYGGAGVSDDEILLRFLAGDELSVAAMRANPAPMTRPATWERVLGEATRLPTRYFHFENAEVSMTLRR